MYKKVKAWLTKRPRSQDGWHVSDLLYPRKAYFQRLDPKPMTDVQAGYFIAGHGHHHVVEAILKRNESKQPWGVLTYAAALVEGEGSFGATGSDNPTTYIAVANTKKSLVNWLKKKFGGSVLKDQRGAKNKAKFPDHPCFEWKLCGAEAGNFVRAIYPFLLAKRPQADIWLKLRDITDEGARGKAVPFATKKEKQRLLEQLRSSRFTDSDISDFAEKRTDDGEFRKHGILFSPDLRLPYPLEFKTSRREKAPDDSGEQLEKVYDGYLKQLTMYQALMDTERGALLVFYLSKVVAGMGRMKRPAFRFYNVYLSKLERSNIVKKAISGAKLLTEAVKKKNHKQLELCAKWMCRDCPWFKKCDPEHTDPKR